MPVDEGRSRAELLARIASLETQLVAANDRRATASHPLAAPAPAAHHPQPRMAPAAGADQQLGKGPLDGIKVLDFSQYQNGPTATMMLSDCETHTPRSSIC